MDISEQAKGILALRPEVEDKIDETPDLMRLPNKPSKHDKNAKPLRVKIDSKLQAMSDEKWIASMQNFGG